MTSPTILARSVPTSPPMALAPRHIRDDEEPEPEDLTVGYLLTDESHGYCRHCGLEGHIHFDCPQLSPELNYVNTANTVGLRDSLSVPIPSAAHPTFQP